MASNLEDQKNGNISQAIWRVRGRERKSYTLGYDFLSRITTSTFKGLTDASVVNLHYYTYLLVNYFSLTTLKELHLKPQH